MRKIAKKALAFVMAVAITVSGLTLGNVNSTEVKGATTDILFIGNSMTYYNELQDIFEEFAKFMGKDVNTKAATNGGKNLIYQSTASNVVSAIDDGGYEVVIIQDIVSSFNANNLLTGAKQIINVIKQYNPNARIIFYGPWPKENVLTGSGSRMNEFTQGYINAARQTGNTFAPAGEAFYDLYVTEGYNYYADGLHPVPMGSFISAATIYYTLYNNESLKTYTNADLASLNAAVNIAQGNKKDYSLSEFNNIVSRAHKYARAVAPAVADTSGNTKYTSAYYTIEDPTKKVQADLSAYSKIDLSKSSVINVSSSVNTSNTGDKIIDGSTNTRWESAYSDPQYFTIKLDKTYSLNGIKLYWEGAASRKYTIATSTDNVNWTTVFEQKLGNGGNESIKFDTVTNANYVRLYSTERTTSYGVSLFEAELYGSVASGSVETPTEQPTTQAPTTQAPTTVTPTTQAPTTSVAGTNLAVGKTAVASGSENSGMGPDRAVDGNDGTRFSSNFSDDAWIYVDLGATYNVNKVYIDWEGAYGKAFDIQVSSDATNWTTVKSLTGQDGGEDTIEFNATSARYVKIQGVERATGYGYSLWEMGVYATTEIPTTQAPTTQAPSVSTTDNIAKGKASYSSSNEANGMSAAQAVDGNTGTRWASSWTDNEWMYVDLGQSYNVNKVVLNWEGAYGKAYDIQVSNDASNWTTVKSMTDQDGGEDVVTFDATSARYVRMQGITRGTGYGYSLWEMEVYAASTAVETPTEAPTEEPTASTVEGTNVANGRNSSTYLTSNANNGTEGFCYVGNGFSAINTSDENLTNGNNMLGKTATTSEVAYYVDLGANYSVNKAVVFQGSTNSNYFDSYAINYSIYYSTDAVTADNQGNITWNLAGTCTNGSIYSGAKVSSATNVSDNGDTINLTGANNARSIKIVFDKDSCMGTGTNGAGTGTIGTVSLLSVRVYTGTSSNVESAVSGTDLALNKTTYQSGSESDAMAADKAVDGNNGTRFSSNYVDDAWMYVDLGAIYSISKVYINWEGAYGKAYDIQVSNDGVNWTTVQSVTNGDGGEDTITFNATSARYVKMQGVQRATIWGYSMWDFQVIAN